MKAEIRTENQNRLYCMGIHILDTCSVILCMHVSMIILNSIILPCYTIIIISQVSTCITILAPYTYSVCCMSVHVILSALPWGHR